MTQRITVGFIGADFATLSAAIASIAPGLFVEPIVIEVHATTPNEAIIVPSTLLPTGANPLVIMSFKQDPVASPFADAQSETGSLSTYPAPQPRLVAATMDSFDLRADNTHLDAFSVNGDVTITADNGVIADKLLVTQGQIIASRLSSTSVDATISNCEVRRSGQDSAVFIKNCDGVKVYHNTLLQRRQDASDVTIDTYAIEMVDSVVEAKNNIFAADGLARSAVRFIGDPTGSVFEGNFYASFDRATRFSFGLSTVSTIETSDQNLWAGFMTSETGNKVGDPEFREKDDATDIDLDVSNTSPTMAMSPKIVGVDHDLRGERRPIDFVTSGAHDHAEVIVDGGQKRFLEIISGLSTQPVTKAVLGRSSDHSLFGIVNFTAKDPSDPDFDPLFTPVDIDGIVAPGNPGEEGLTIFRPYFQVTEPIYGELLDPVADRADEIGLLSADNVVFMVKRMHSIPFDATGFMHLQAQIPVEFVG